MWTLNEIQRTDPRIIASTSAVYVWIFSKKEQKQFVFKIMQNIYNIENFILNKTILTGLIAYILYVYTFLESRRFEHFAVVRGHTRR